MRSWLGMAALAASLLLPVTTALAAPAASAPSVKKPAAKASAAKVQPAKATGLPVPGAPQNSASSGEVAVKLADWIRTTGDNRGLPYVIIDKVAAKVFVFSKFGQFIGSTPALVGSAKGDDSTPGVGDRELSDIKPSERTTPAGRFMAAYGPSVTGEQVFWVDYETAISLHPVVTTKPKERRLQRLRSPTPDDNRITFGCINVPTAFYNDVVRKTFMGTQGVVYILPEAQSLAEVFPMFYLQAGSQLASNGGGAPAGLPGKRAVGPPP